MAMNFDQYQPTDLGSCGEPYTVLAACALSVGQLAHGYFGVGLAGQQRPPDPWNDSTRARVRRAPRVPLGPLQLRDHRLLRLPGLPVRRDALQLQPQRRPGERPACATPDDGELPDRQGAGLPRFGQRPHRALRQPAALRDGVREHRRHRARSRPDAVLRERLRQPDRTMPEGVTAPRVVVALNILAAGRHRRRDDGKPDPAGPRRVPGRPQRAERDRAASPTTGGAR